MNHRKMLERLERAATDLEVVQLPMVLVGGATMPLYVDDDGLTVLRETRDVDVMVLASSYKDFSALEDRLRGAGFSQRVYEQGPRCRWYKADEVYDIVDIRTDYPDDEWVLPVGEGIERRRLPSGRQVPVLSPGRFLAAKVAALVGRGGTRWYESSDFEDIVLLLESHPQLQPWLVDTPASAVRAVSEWAERATGRPGIREEIEATVSRGPEMERRVEAVFDRLLWLAGGWPSAAGSAT